MSRLIRRRLTVSIALSLAAAGCGDEAPPPGVDAGAELDAGASRSDLGPRSMDAAAPSDAGAPDADPVDTGGPPTAGDRDGDGVADPDDAFPDDPAEFLDSDGDGVGNYADLDEDDDGVPDLQDELPFDPTGSRLFSIDDLEFNDGGPSAQIVGDDSGRRAPPFRIDNGTLEAFGFDAFVFELPAGPQRLSVRVNAAEPVHVVLVRGFVADPVRPPGAPDNVYGFELEGGSAVTLEVRRPFAYGPDLPYTVEVFFDADLDGVDDDVERARGMSPRRIDQDGDGLPPLVELVDAPDPDGDGIPAWLDPDSDGDGVPDRLEDLADRDRDDLPGFLDSDSDGDGAPDGAARSPSGDLLDTDGDLVPDAFDLDDDGDGIPDAADPSASPAPAASPYGPSALRVERVYADIGGAQIRGWGRVGDPLVIEGVGFGAQPRVLFQTPAGPTEATPTSASATEIRVVAPAEATELRVLAGALSTEERVKIVPAEGPRLDPARVSVLSGSTRATLTGENLQDVLYVEVGSQRVGFMSRSATELVLAAAQIRGGFARAVTATTRSNPVPIQVTIAAQYRIAVPAGAPVRVEDLRLWSSEQEDQRVFGTSGTIDVGTSGPTVITAFLPGAPRDSVFLQALRLPGDLLSTLDAQSTVLTRVMALAVDPSRYEDADLRDIRDALAALPEVAAATQTLEAGLAANPRYLDSPPAAFSAQVRASIQAAGPVLLTYVSSPPAGGPVIFQVDPMSQFDVTVRETAGPQPSVMIDNDTSLYLSAEVRLDEGEEVVVPHADGLLSHRIIGTQAGAARGFWSNEVTLDEPRGRNARVVVLTGGVNAPGPLGPGEGFVHRNLVLRTAFDKIALPILIFTIGEVFDGEEVADAFMKLMAQNAIPQAQALITAVDAGEARRIVDALADLLINDFENVGPITTAAAVGTGDVVAAIGKRLGATAIPVLGQLKTILNGVDGVATGVNFGVAITDMLMTPGRLVFTVSHTPELLRRSPDWFFREDLLVEQTVSVEGRQMEALRDADGNIDYPRFIFGSTGESWALETTPDLVRHDRLEVRLDPDDLGTIGQDLTVSVSTSASTSPIALPPIGITDELQLSSFAPRLPCVGEQVVLQGADFSIREGETDVILVGADAGTRLSLTPTRVTPREITFTLPPSVRDETAWRVSVSTGPLGARRETGALLMSICDSGVIGRWVVTIGPWDQDDYPFRGPEGCQYPSQPNIYIPGSWLIGIALFEDGRAFFYDCNNPASPANANGCRRIVGNRQRYGGIGSWRQSGDLVFVDTPSPLPCTSRQARVPSRWSLRYTQENGRDQLVGTAFSACAASDCYQAPSTFPALGERP